MMIEKGKISNIQFSMLIIMFIVGTATLIVPAIVTGIAKQDGWLSTLLSLCLGFVFVMVFAKIAERNPDITLIQTCEKILGKWLGRLVSLLYTVYFLFLTAIFLRIAGDLITTHVLTETPIQATETLFLIIMIMAVRLGLEPFSRAAEMLFPHIVFFILLFFFFLLPQVKGENMTPVLEHGLEPVLFGTYKIIGIPYLNLVIFLMLTPFVSTPSKIKKSFFISILIGGMFITMITLFSIFVLGADATNRLNYAPYILAQKIQIGNFIQRIEIVAGAFIFISLFVKSALTYYCFILSTAQTFHLKNYKILTLPFGLIVLVLSISLFPNIIYFHTFVSVAWTILTLIFGLLLPLLILIVDLFKSRLANRTDQEAGK
ncbi:endospore germination permease [Bacillus sp. T3]|uniref:GerAB/ArcD/ProY family transporter n=1 Tax=Bacillus sp. T3 TaxID=467262 RepID=UPI002981B043|nr:endospore germination permease [Bacillus sp. T3]